MDQPLLIPNIPYRIRIGVTGHRTLPDPEKLAERVRGLLELGESPLLEEDSRFQIRTSKGPPVRFSLLTPLAQGADRLVAHEVLKTPDARILPILPLRKEDYMSDFRSRKSRDEFESLLALSRKVVTLPYPTDVKGRGARTRAYRNVGRYVVENCDVLIALWNGKPAAGEGGTAEIVEYARQKRRPLVIVSTNPPYELHVEQPLGLDLKAMSRIHDFNATKITDEEMNSYAANVEGGIFEVEESATLPPDSKKNVRDYLMPDYVKASKIAKANQTAYLRSGSFVYLFSALAVATAALFILFPAYSLAWFSVEAVLLVAIFSIVHWADRRRTHKKWIESRFLAERIRVSFFFAACGVEVSPMRILPFMRVAHRPDDWMIRVFDEIWNRLPRLKGCNGTACANVSAYIRKALIQDQIGYHTDKSGIRRRTSEKLERAGKTIFFVALVAALLHVAHSTASDDHSSPASLFLTYLALSLPAIGAAVGGIRAHREYSRLEKRSQNMVAALAELDEQFSHVTDYQELELLLRETEELMLRETQDWLMLMKFVKLEAAA